MKMKKLILSLCLSFISIIGFSQTSGIKNVGVYIPPSSGGVDVVNAINHVEGVSYTKQDTTGNDSIYVTVGKLHSNIYINYADTLVDSVVVVISDTVPNSTHTGRVIGNVRKYATMGDVLTVFVKCGATAKKVRFYGYVANTSQAPFDQNSITYNIAADKYYVINLVYNGYTFVADRSINAKY